MNARLRTELVLVLALATPLFADKPETLRVSASPNGECNGHSDNGNSSRHVSAGGRYVVFHSFASNLDPLHPDPNGYRDVFVWDRLTDAVTLISRNAAGNAGDGTSEYPSISWNGRYISYNTYAWDIVSTPTLVVHDRDWDNDEIFDEDEEGATRNTPAIFRCNGSIGTGGDATLSPCGRFVAFSANDLACDDDNMFGDAYVYDRDWDGGSNPPNGIFDEKFDRATKTVRVSVGPWNPEKGRYEQGNDHSHNPVSISANGRFVAFFSGASNLVPDDTNGFYDVFLHDRDRDEDGVFDEQDDPSGVKTVRVSVRSDAKEAHGDSFHPSVSAHGRYVTFVSEAADLVDDDTNGVRDVFIHDTLTAETKRISTDSAGRQADGASIVSVYADDSEEQYVVFTSAARNLVLPDCENYDEVFVYDRLTGAVTRVAISTTCEQANGRSQAGGPSTASPDGRYVAFPSFATNLVDSDPNDIYSDIFLRDRGTCMTPAVTKHPEDKSVYYKHTASFTMAAIGDPTLEYQWRKDGSPLACDERISGCDTPTLTIKNAQVGNSGDSGQYDCVVTNDCDCSEVWSAPAKLTVKHALGDMDCSGAVDFDDIDGFVLAITSRKKYEAAYPNCDFELADVDRDGNVDFDDIDGFVECLVNNGCP